MAATDHAAYFESRAAVERELASTAPVAYIAQIHLQMASLYEALIDHPERRDVLKIVADPWGPEIRTV